MKYRIVTDDKSFRIQGRAWFWPFWIWVTEPCESGERFVGFGTLEEAQQYISKQADNEKYVSWRVVG